MHLDGDVMTFDPEQRGRRNGSKHNHLQEMRQQPPRILEGIRPSTPQPYRRIAGTADCAGPIIALISVPPFGCHGCLTERMRKRPALTNVLLGASVTLGLVLGSCGEATPRSAERFCGELQAHVAEIQTVPESADAIPAFITLFSKMGEVAPLDVQRDWETVYGSLKKAAAVNVDDPEALAEVNDSALQAQRSAQNVVTWAKSNCGLDLPPVAAVGGGAAVIAAPTTVVDAAGNPVGTVLPTPVGG